MTHGKMATMVEEEKDEKVVDGDKQQLVTKPAPEPEDNFCELEEVEDEEDDQESETPIILREKERKRKKTEKMNKKEEKKKSQSELARDKKKEVAPAEGKEVPYPLVPSKKDKERHVARFLDIFKKLEITMPFGEALQQMPLYFEFLKDMLTRKNNEHKGGYIPCGSLQVDGTSTWLFKENKGGYILCGSLLVKDFTRLLEISRTVGCLGTGRRHGLWPNQYKFCMVSRKNKATTSRPQPHYNTHRFTSKDAWNSYTDNVLRQNILPKRNMKLFVTDFDEFRIKLVRRNWHRMLANLMERSIDVAHVKEFYANIYDPEDKSPKQVRVRGNLIKFDADSLNTFQGRLFLLTPDPQELATRLCIRGRGFVLNAEGLPWKLLGKDLTTLAHTWSVLSYFNLAPTSHISDLNLDKARLVYGLVMKMDMNVGALISGQITLMAQFNSSRIGFLALITIQCMAQGVTSDSLTFESLSPAINLVYIKKNCWNLDDPTVSFSGTHKVRARGFEGLSSVAYQPSTAPAPIPSTPPVLATSGSSTQSTNLMMAMLQSIHQGQILVMQSLHNLAQHQPIMEEFSLQVAWPRVHPSSHGEGEAFAAQEPQPDPKTTPTAQEDDSEATSPESFVPKTDPEVDPMIAEASPQASPVSTPVLKLNTPQGSPAGTPVLHLTDDEAMDQDPPQDQ
ncbi:hypothetical protein HKD37_13G035641 [Glycine soja]